jgi:hypothetical protein
MAIVRSIVAGSSGPTSKISRACASQLTDPVIRSTSQVPGPAPPSGPLMLRPPTLRHSARAAAAEVDVATAEVAAPRVERALRDDSREVHDSVERTGERDRERGGFRALAAAARPHSG